MDKLELVEGLANLEHEQWMSWTKYLNSRYKLPKKLIEKWMRNWKPYNQLTDDEKEKDKIWARKVLRFCIKNIHID